MLLDFNPLFRISCTVPKTNVGQLEHLNSIRRPSFPLFILLYNPTKLKVIFHFVLALPATFIEKLKNQEKKEGESVTLRCELSKPAAVVQWKKDSEILKPGEKYDMKQAEGSCILQILNLKIEDSGAYTCICGDEKTFAALKVTGMDS